MFKVYYLEIDINVQNVVVRKTRLASLVGILGEKKKECELG